MMSDDKPLNPWSMLGSVCEGFKPVWKKRHCSTNMLLAKSAGHRTQHLLLPTRSSKLLHKCFHLLNDGSKLLLLALHAPAKIPRDVQELVAVTTITA